MNVWGHKLGAKVALGRERFWDKRLDSLRNKKFVDKEELKEAEINLESWVAIGRWHRLRVRELQGANS
jgi:hypothetical protein